MSASDWVHLDVQRVLHETEDALLVFVGGEQHWLPKSQVADAERYHAGDVNCTVSITTWLAERKGLA